jgi:hypothetical protein
LRQAFEKAKDQLHTDTDVCQWNTDAQNQATFKFGKTSKLSNGFSKYSLNCMEKAIMKQNENL